MIQTESDKKFKPATGIKRKIERTLKENRNVYIKKAVTGMKNQNRLG